MNRAVERPGERPAVEEREDAASTLEARLPRASARMQPSPPLPLGHGLGGGQSDAWWRQVPWPELICCGLPLLVVGLAAAGGLAAVGAWIGGAWPLLLALALLIGGTVFWRRGENTSCTACGLLKPASHHDAHDAQRAERPPAEETRS